MDQQENAFLDTLRQQPDDDVTRLVYADWLDEQGGNRNLAKSAFLRLHCELAEMQDAKDFLKESKRLFDMAKSLDHAWLSVVSNMKIENCELAFAFRCPKQWDQLKATEKDGVRFCEGCQKEVYFCQTIEEARDHAWQGECVAVQLGVSRSQGDLEPPRLTLGFIGGGYQEQPRVKDRR